MCAAFAFDAFDSYQAYDIPLMCHEQRANTHASHFVQHLFEPAILADGPQVFIC
jgi:hypothetical protein